MLYYLHMASWLKERETDRKREEVDDRCDGGGVTGRKSEWENKPMGEELKEHDREAAKKRETARKRDSQKERQPERKKEGNIERAKEQKNKRTREWERAWESERKSQIAKYLDNMTVR